MRKPDIYMVRGPDGLDDILDKLKYGPLAVDTETTGLDWRHDRVGSINLAAGHTAIFAYKDALAPVCEYLSDQVKRRRELVFHHAKFDMHMMRETFGLHIPYPVHDTKIESHVLDNRGCGTSAYSNHHLKDLARTFIDPSAKEPQKELMAAIKAAGGKGMGDWLLAPWKLYAKYSALDAWYTLQLHTLFYDMIWNWQQPEEHLSPLHKLYENEQWLILCLRDMEERGVQVNMRKLEKWGKRLARERSSLLEELSTIVGKSINWNSHPQLRQLLYEDLGLTTERLTKKSKKTGEQQLSTDKNALVRLSHPIAPIILKYRKAQHSYSAGYMSMLRALTEDNTIHCNFNQNVDTGRMSCSDPNLQGQDRNSGIRDVFEPRDELELRMADAMAVEMRFAAHYSEEKSLVRGFNKHPDFDPHMATAKRMYGLKKPSDGQRKYSKDMNFASIYGAGEDQTTEMLMIRISSEEARHACKELGYRPKLGESPHRALAQKLRERYKQIFPTMGSTARALEKKTEAFGFVTNAYGRHRYLDKDEAYKSFNSRIQGSAADYTKYVMTNAYRELQLGTGEIAMLLQIHDEVIYETAGDPRTDKKFLEIANDYTSFKVPITSDMSGSKTSWQKKEKVKL
jgi:DNA polymerase-1